MSNVDGDSSRGSGGDGQKDGGDKSVLYLTKLATFKALILPSTSPIKLYDTSSMEPISVWELNA